MTHNSIRRLLGLLLLAAACVVVYLLMPPRIRSVTYIPQPALKQSLYTLNDSAVGGASWSRLTDSTGFLTSQIQLDATPGRNPWAGFGLDLRLLTGGYDNWTLFDTLYLEIRADGIKEVQLKILTHDPDFTSGDRGVYRSLVKEVPISGSWQVLAVPVEQFYVPDWWYSDNGVSKEFDQKHLEAVARVEFLPSGESLRGQPTRILVKSMRVVGHSNLYFGILVAVLLLILLAALGSPRPKKRNRT